MTFYAVPQCNEEQQSIHSHKKYRQKNSPFEENFFSLRRKPFPRDFFSCFLYTALMLKNYLWIFLISMVPLIELRGAIPVSQALELPLVQSYVICIIGNMIPVPIIYLFARKFLEWGQDKKAIGSFFLVKGTNAGKKMQEKAGRGLFVALFLFVGIPLPGTGAWTGTLAASLLDMKFRDTVIAVLAGVLFAGILMMLISFGAFSALFAAIRG